MSFLRLFSPKLSPKPTVAAARLDGLRPDYARVVCAFQSIIEAEASPHYDGLRSALAYARFASDNGLPLSIMLLRAKYNDYCYADSQYTSNHR